MRINLHPNGKSSVPGWFGDMLNDYIEEFRKEYSVSDTDVYRYFFCDKLERIQQLFANHGVNIEIYTMEDLPSRGVIIPDDDPTVVMYKLRHQTEPEEES